jgi:penicillin G amidase
MNKNLKQAVRPLLLAAAMAMTAGSAAVAREQEALSSAARLSSSSVAGLKAPGKILVDVWGIPHIYAANERDLFFLQGFNAADVGSDHPDAAMSVQGPLSPAPSRSRAAPSR